MKTLPSMSGLLPACFKSDPASIGIGWNTINPKEDTELDNNFGPMLEQVDDTKDNTPIKNSDVIKVGDVVYVLPDYKNQCEDTLKAGGVYVVHKIAQHISVDDVITLRHKPNSCIYSRFVKRIKDKDKVLVCGITALHTVQFTEGHILHSDTSIMPIIVILKNNSRFWCYEDDVYLQEDNQ